MPRTPEQNKIYIREYYRKNKETIKSRVRVWEAANPEKVAEYHRRWKQDNPDKVLASSRRCNDRLSRKISSRAWRVANPEKRKQTQLRYAYNHPERVRAQIAKNRANRKQATPPWLTAAQHKQIEAFYTEAHRLEQADGIKRHVDHIYPLQGKTVSGLHVPWNLQILTAKANRHKSNLVV